MKTIKKTKVVSGKGRRSSVKSAAAPKSDYPEAELSALLDASRSILRFRDFPDTARAIFDSCKNLVGASAGYVALLSSDCTENDVVFLDPGNLTCTVATTIPMPIRGLRGRAYRIKKPVYDNEFQSSRFLKLLPSGHVKVESVLFAPLVIEERAIGLLGLANKPGGFTERDARLAAAFGELASIALQNSRLYMSLHREEERFRSLAEAATDAIISADAEGRINFLNDGALKMFRYKKSELIGGRVAKLMPERFRVRHSRALSKASSGSKGFIGRTLETFGLRKGGEEFPIELSLSRWESRDGVFFTSIIRDISERKIADEEIARYRTSLEERVAERTSALRRLNEELEHEIAERRRTEDMLRHSQKMQAVGQLTGGIAHDFNNRLAAIINYSYLLLLKLRDEDPLKTHVKTIHAIAENAASLTQSLLTVSSKQVMDPRPADLNNVIRDIEKILIRVIGEDIVLKTMLSGEALIAKVDSSQLENVLLNLATNARDAMTHGGVLMIETDAVNLNEGFLKTHGFGTPGRYAQISFSDTGLGMDRETTERVFEPFFTTKERGKGTGLGLSMVYGIIRQHGGGIDVYSEHGKGTVFKIYIPLIDGFPGTAP